MSNNQPWMFTVKNDFEFNDACEAISNAWHESFDREHAIKVLDTYNIAPVLRQALAEMTFEEWEDFVVNYLGD